MFMKKYLLLAAALIGGMQMNAQNVKLNGVYEWMRNDDSEQPLETIGSVFEKNGVYTSNYMYGQDGWNYVGYLAIPANGLYTMSWDGNKLSDPEKDPLYTKEGLVDANKNVDWEKAQNAINFKLMQGTSGSAYVDGKVVTVFSRDESSTVDDELFAVRKWDAKTGELLSDETFPKSATLESAGMSYNPKDGKVYGLFYLTGRELPTEITEDPEYFADQDDDLTDGDAGYALCTIDLTSMKVTPITPGMYYDNFVTFAINSEGRAFALTSGGTAGYEGEGGRMYNIDNELTGAQLYEFNLKTGLRYANAVEVTDGDGEIYTEYVPLVPPTGYCSQYRRQSACFAKSNPNIMYWNGFYNSGKGYNDSGSYSSLSDKEWRTNHKYDTCLYAVDITTGLGTRLASITDRYRFSALWADGDDCSDGSGYDMTAATGISNVKPEAKADNRYYDLSGRQVAQPTKGLYIVNGTKIVIK